MLINTSNINQLNRGFSKVYRSAYDETPEWGSKVATTIRSNHGTEVHGWMQRILAMREWDGPRLIQNLVSTDYTLTNKTYELTVGVEVNDIEDDSLGVYEPMFSEMGRAQRKWPDQQLKTVLQGGTTGVGPFGEVFFTTSHALDPAGNQSNNFTSTALNATNYDNVRAAMTAYTGEDGEPLGVMPNLLVVPPQLEKTAREILNADIIANSAGTAGVTNVLRGSAELLVVPELANQSTTWYLMDTTKGIKPLVWQLRQSPSLVSKTSPTDENVFNDDQFLYGSKARGVAGYGLWWLAARAIA